MSDKNTKPVVDKETQEAIDRVTAMLIKYTGGK
jgi:hypothetical protein